MNYEISSKSYPNFDIKHQSLIYTKKKKKKKKKILFFLKNLNFIEFFYYDGLIFFF